MNIFNLTVIYSLIWLISGTRYVSLREYFINDEDGPKYLYHKFDNITEEVFPNDVIIRISMSKIVGTLFFSIDRNMNELIVSLSEETANELEVELNKQLSVISLYRLCECVHCRYQILTLRIQIRDSIELQCNYGNVRKLPIGKFKKMNTLNTHIKSTLSSTNEAHMWLLNAPDRIFHPINEVIRGCIFSVWYNNIQIQFTSVTPNIGPKCIKSCNDNICNGGQCHDRYDGIPICDCATTFLNGRYCNDSISPMNMELENQSFKFHSVKVSWRSSVNEILQMNSSHISTAIQRKNAKLIFEYLHPDEPSHSRIILSDQYTPNSEYICIIDFHINYIDIRLFHNQSWTNKLILTSIDLREEIFDSLSLHSGDGSMDIVHKGDNDYRWRKVNDIQHIHFVFGQSISSPMLAVIIIVMTITFGTIGALYLWFVIRCHQGGWTALHYACDKGYVYIVQLLLDRGADINCVDKNGWTALHCACDRGHEAIVSLLLNKGSDTECRDKNGLTGLHLACDRGYDNLIRLLMDRGLDKENLDNSGQTILHFACEKGYSPTVKLLLDRGADINCRDNNGGTGLHYACRSNQNQIVQVLLKQGTDINCRDNDGWTALHYACGNGHAAIVQLLLDSGLNIDIIDLNGLTGLHLACYNGLYEIVKLLLDKGSNINCTNINEHTGLHYACGNGHEAIVQLLMDRGSDITCRNNYDKTPWDMARQNNHNKIIDILEKAVRITIKKGSNNNGWTNADYRFIAAINQCNKERIASSVNDILEIFNNKYKSEMMEYIHEKTPLTERMRIAINCLVASLQCQLPNNDDVYDVIESLLEELCLYSETNIAARRIIEMILYNLCQYNHYQPIIKNDKLRNIINEYCSNEGKSEEIKISSTVVISHTIVDISMETNSDQAGSYLSDVIQRMEESDTYIGFTRQEVLDAISKMDSIIEENNDKEYISSCMDIIGWHIVPKSKRQWKEHINSHVTLNPLLESRLEEMYNTMKNVRDTEYWMNITVLFVHARIFVLPSNTERDPRSLQYLMALLYNKYKYKNALSRHRHYIIECMMDLIEDAASDNNLNLSVSTIMDNVLSFVAYYSIIDNYTYERDLAFLNSYLSEDTKVTVWANVIMCFCANQNGYVDILSKYLDTDDNVNKDKIIVYMAFIKSMEYATEDIHPIHQWSNMDYCLVTEIREYELMPRDNIASFNSNIIRIFSKAYKYEIIENISDDCLTESDKHLINCLCVSLHCESIYNNGNESITISMLDEFYPHTMNNIVAMRIVEIILYNVCKYNRYKIVSIRDRIRDVCLRYWTNKNISEEIKLHSSVIICHATEHIDGYCDIDRYIAYLCDVVHRMNLRGSNITFGLSEQEIKAVISKVSVTVAQQMTKSSTNIEYSERISTDINGTMNMIGIMTFTVNRFQSNKHKKKLIYSPYFYTHTNGYKLRLQIYPGGNKIDTHLSVYIYICKGEYDDELPWPCRHTFTLSVVNQNNGEMNKSKTFSYDTSRRNKLNIEDKPQTNYKSYGHQQLIPHSELESVEGFIVNDCIIIKCDTLLLS